MKIDVFELENTIRTWESSVKYNVSESGVHPCCLKELFSKDELDQLLSLRLGYGDAIGSTELRETISRFYPGADLDNILVTAGSAEANFLAIWSSLEPGDELIYMLPNYIQIGGLARSFGVNVRPFYLKEELNWQPEIQELKTLISPRTKMIAVCNPNNPTGSILSEESMQEIIRAATAADAWILSDEVYRGAELQGEETQSFWGRYEKVIVNSGLSKAYGLPGLRIGWSVAPREFISSAISHHDYICIASGIISNRVAYLALQPNMRQKILDRTRKILNKNLDILKEWIGRHAHLLKLIPPRAGAIAFPRYSMKINSTELCEKIRREKSVLIPPGDCFGMDNFIRIGIGEEKGHLSPALDLIAETLREISSL